MWHLFQRYLYGQRVLYPFACHHMYLSEMMCLRQFLLSILILHSVFLLYKRVTYFLGFRSTASVLGASPYWSHHHKDPLIVAVAKVFGSCLSLTLSLMVYGHDDHIIVKVMWHIGGRGPSSVLRLCAGHKGVFIISLYWACRRRPVLIVAAGSIFFELPIDRSYVERNIVGIVSAEGN